MAKTTIAHFTDTHLGQKLVMADAIAGGKMRYDSEPEEHWDHLRRVLDDIAERGISRIVFGGDIGTADSVPRFFELLERYDFEISVILGNHDAYANVRQYWDCDNAVEGKLCYSRIDGSLKQIFIDTSVGELGGSQRAWLADELVSVETAVLFAHHPVLPLDTPVDKSGAALRDREETRSLLLDSRCKISIFCGHYHMYDATGDANIRQFVTPSTSYQIVKASETLQTDPETFGYQMLTFEDARMETQTVMLTADQVSRRSR
ncbi:hypothetical protein HGP17_15220 [Rhizobium sp. P38BS-XIX]|uniref:metallophosphoesterase family protein n=1 Tax=Rhizobium sp. P38BS-XIX TaxID=2726740 RepID=UPI0014567814|nr:metallophosphoesterase [Rhizobium sp. P38BS-XIX]NLR98164.1 hypothetical protein [Rhizobium sp. P38BS-XIX]